MGGFSGQPKMYTPKGWYAEKHEFETRVRVEGLWPEVVAMRDKLERRYSFNNNGLKVYDILMQLFPQGPDGKTIRKPFETVIPQLQQALGLVMPNQEVEAQLAVVPKSWERVPPPAHAGPVEPETPPPPRVVAKPPVVNTAPPVTQEPPLKEEKKNGKRITTRQKIEWVFEHMHLKLEELPVDAAPTIGTWALFRWVKTSPANTSAFYLTWTPKFVPNKSDLEAAERFQDDGRNLSEFIDRIETEIVAENSSTHGFGPESSVPQTPLGTGVRG